MNNWKAHIAEHLTKLEARQSMTINFMNFRNEQNLRDALEQRLQLGFATIKDVVLFCESNNLEASIPTKITSQYSEIAQKHETGIFCKTRAPADKLKYLLSDWRNLIFFWTLFFLFADWFINFYFDEDILSEIEVNITYTWF